jgi:hypothetical protein
LPYLFLFFVEYDCKDNYFLRKVQQKTKKSFWERLRKMGTVAGTVAKKQSFFFLFLQQNSSIFAMETRKKNEFSNRFLSS